MRKLNLPAAGSRTVDLNWLPWLLAVAVGLQALYIATDTIYWTLRSLHPIPFWDSWENVKFLKLGQPVTLRWLWSQHNEHRIPIPRLISLTDYRFFGGCGYFDIALIWLMQIGSALLITSLSFDVIGRDRSRRPWRILAAGFIVCFAFSSAQMENFQWAFQTGFVGMMFFSILAFFCLSRAIEAHHSSAWIFGGALAAMASALGLASGMMTVLIFAAVCWIARVRRRDLFIILLLFVAFAAAYLHGYTSPPQHASPMEALLHHRSILVQYFFVFAGNMFRLPGAPGADPVTAAMIGSLVVALFALAVVFAPLSRAQDDSRSTAVGVTADRRSEEGFPPASLALFSIAAVVIGQGVLTGLGRYMFGLGQALSSRYATPVSFLWISVLCLILALILDEARHATRTLVAFCTLVFIMTGLLTLQEGRIGKDHAHQVTGLELAANAMRLGVVDLDAFAKVYPHPDVVAAARPFLLQHRLSVFSDNRYLMLGRHLGDIATLSPAGECLGHFDQVASVPMQSAAKVSGWAWSVKEKVGPSQIVLTDQTGAIVGLASEGFDRPDVKAAIPEVKDLSVGWQGYAKAAREVSAYALIDGGREACRLHGTFDIPPP